MAKKPTTMKCPLCGQRIVGDLAILSHGIMGCNPSATKKTVPSLAIPKEIKPFVIRKFRSKDRTKRLVVLRLPQEKGFAIHTVVRHTLQQPALRTFSTPTDSEIPTPVWLAMLRNLARWVAGHMARTAHHPSVRKERSRRKRFMKKALANFNAHVATKQVVQQLKTPPKSSSKRVPLRHMMPWICIYDPKQSCGDTTFRIHTAYCSKLDHERRKAIRDRGGDSWVIEAKTAAEAQAMQLEEFNEDAMGYDEGDFHIHACEK